ncbi:hypothetical protein [Micromonospora carbonacea]|uniref:Uncharacterized protein n=1 Tax=Micromonospora carbonacea TaxID=47853 RepID=A0A1C4WWJ2_9ACTN|nr:hypothetical protein [Micromonospora carbonacea]SCF00533.1 hypothetical protein GA0070563_10478 [Micromonospora carbonacea]
MSAPDRRAEVIAGLRELANALEANPELPLPGYRVQHCVLAADDATGQAEVARAAELLGIEMTTVGGSTIAEQQFGGVTYEVFYVSRQRIADHDALMSYRGTVVPDAVPAEA